MEVYEPLAGAVRRCAIGLMRQISNTIAGTTTIPVMARNQVSPASVPSPSECTRPSSQAETLAKAALLSGPDCARDWLSRGGLLVFDDGSHTTVDV